MLFFIENMIRLIIRNMGLERFNAPVDLIDQPAAFGKLMNVADAAAGCCFVNIIH